jgi:acylphosphatase
MGGRRPLLRSEHEFIEFGLRFGTGVVMTKAVRYRITGRVQGVGFRYFVFRRASEIGVTGWVRNMADGSVETVVTGSDEQLRRMAASLAEGPRWSRVVSVDGVDDDGGSVGDRFEVVEDGR